MGKNITQQRQGKGSPVFKKPSFRFAGKVEYQKGNSYVVQDIIKCPIHTAPLPLKASLWANKKRLAKVLLKSVMSLPSKTSLKASQSLTLKATREMAANLFAPLDSPPESLEKQPKK